MDDLPPAEMGALGVSLVCAICGTAEKKSPNGVGGCSGGNGQREEHGGDAEVEVEVTRCSRCRKGCCEACYKYLPVHCRGSKIVAPGEFFPCVCFTWLRPAGCACVVFIQESPGTAVAV